MGVNKRAIIEDQYKRLQEASSSCSTNCRYITFALLAVIWGLYGKVEASMYSKLYVLLGLLIIYLIIDTLQYLIPTILHRSDLIKLREGGFRVNIPDEFNKGVFTKEISDEATRKTLISRSNQISKITYFLFIAKIISLLIVSILIILFIINMGINIQQYVK